jgi:hypothetical protein
MKKLGSELACQDGWRRLQERVEVKLALYRDTDGIVVLR